MTLKVQHPAPDFEAQGTRGPVHLAALRGQAVVLYFYPRDSTPGCTTEARDFTALLPDFEALGAVIFGVSRDSLRSHCNFMEKQGIGFDLISDPDETLCQRYEVMKLKKLYGKTYMGIDRSTFLIDPDGVLRQVWEGVKVPGHAEAVLAALKAL